MVVSATAKAQVLLGVLQDPPAAPTAEAGRKGVVAGRVAEVVHIAAQAELLVAAALLVAQGVHSHAHVPRCTV